MDSFSVAELWLKQLGAKSSTYKPGFTWLVSPNNAVVRLQALHAWRAPCFTRQTFGQKKETLSSYACDCELIEIEAEMT